jgi:hypothetical protein
MEASFALTAARRGLAHARMSFNSTTVFDIVIRALRVQNARDPTRIVELRDQRAARRGSNPRQETRRTHHAAPSRRAEHVNTEATEFVDSRTISRRGNRSERARCASGRYARGPSARGARGAPTLRGARELREVCELRKLREVRELREVFCVAHAVRELREVREVARDGAWGKRDAVYGGAPRGRRAERAW